jgi:hypothetical protein
MEIRPPAKVKLPPVNVEGWWIHSEGSTRKGFMWTISGLDARYYYQARFTSDQEGIRLKLDPNATLKKAEACYRGIDLFCKEWNGESVLPLVKTITVSSGERYQVHLTEVYVGIHDPASPQHEAPKPKQSSS